MLRVVASFVLLILINEVQSKYGAPELYDSSYNPWYKDFLCKDNKDVISYFEPLPGSKFNYYIWIEKEIENGTVITVQFDSEVTVYLTSKYNNISDTRYKTEPDTVNNIFTLEFYNVTHKPQHILRVEGKVTPNHPPYVLSFKINGVEKCREPNLGFFGKYYPISVYYPEAPDKKCGRRKLNVNSQNPLIVRGSGTKEGWWPWHAALFKVARNTLAYICGGTLISKHLVLTAAHCVTINGVPVNPEVLGVVLGKYSLFGTDIASQSIEVFEVIVHEDFQHRKLDNDIALLKLMAAAVYTNYVQPACLWFDGIYDGIDSLEVTGTVVGWGFDRTDNLTKTLQTATMPQVPDVTCILFEPTFYHNILNGKKFCAGHSNGTTPCNGDSGGGFVVFLKDPIKGDIFYFPSLIQHPGAWYVKGIVSTTLARADAAICDPNGYTVFTDVAKYRDWILNYMNHDK